MRPKKSKMADKKMAERPTWDTLGMGTKGILFPHIPVIAKMQIKKMYHGSAWEPYLPPQLIDHIKLIITPKVHQRDTAIQTEVILKTWPQEEMPPQNTSSANDRKSGNNPSLKLNKEKVKKKTLLETQ